MIIHVVKTTNLLQLMRWALLAVRADYIWYLFFLIPILSCQ